jgi:hypothetical protein
MARKFRVQYPGAIYHVMNRGDQREAVFKDDEDRRSSWRRWVRLAARPSGLRLPPLPAPESDL